MFRQKSKDRIKELFEIKNLRGGQKKVEQKEMKQSLNSSFSSKLKTTKSSQFNEKDFLEEVQMNKTPSNLIEFLQLLKKLKFVP